MARSWARYASVLSFVVALVGFGSAGLFGVTGLEENGATGHANEPSVPVDAKKVEGHQKCVDCHQVELKSWLMSKHSHLAFDLLRTAPTARQYAEKLGIKTQDIASKSVCIKCHGTAVEDFTGRRVIAGVSCEACHNPSGGESGWLNIHAIYGSRASKRQDETKSHYQARANGCRKAGQLRSSDLYALAKRCFACHVVDDEQLAEAGHDHGDKFELVSKMLDDKVRHNFMLDPTSNAEVATLWLQSRQVPAGRTAQGRKRVMFVVGQLVDAEISLSNLAKATEENDFTDIMIDRVEDVLELLSEDLLDELEETELPSIEGFVTAVEPVWEKLDDDGFDSEDRHLYLETAKAIAIIATNFANRDGSTLAELDELFDELEPAE